MDLDTRMKHYERSVGSQLTLRCPAILRLDGRAFHSFTKGFDKPFDATLHECMVATGKALCQDISTAVLAYGQSDEISLLLIDFANFDTQQWFDGKVQKIVSTAASRATLIFNKMLSYLCRQAELDDQRELFRHLEQKQHQAMFDARVFSTPQRDVVNYFIWRQQDAIRNSVQSLGQANFSHKKLHGMSRNNIVDMLFKTGIHWEKQPHVSKYGWGVAKISGKKETPVGTINTKVWKEVECPDISEHRIFVGQWMPNEEILTLTEEKEHSSHV